ncbi:MAG: hypothetical protein AB7N76_02480 [Planctomycetota bacterium]
MSEDDRNLADMDDEELARAWDLWFRLAQHTNDYDPPYSHGVFAGLDRARLAELLRGEAEDDPDRAQSL